MNNDDFREIIRKVTKENKFQAILDDYQKRHPNPDEAEVRYIQVLKQKISGYEWAIHEISNEMGHKVNEESLKALKNEG